LPPAKASSAARSFLIISSGVCRFLFMRVDGAHAPELSSLMDQFFGSTPPATFSIHKVRPKEPVWVLLFHNPTFNKATWLT
jgi:hypothetical protein